MRVPVSGGSDPPAHAPVLVGASMSGPKCVANLDTQLRRFAFLKCLYLVTGRAQISRPLKSRPLEGRPVGAYYRLAYNGRTLATSHVVRVLDLATHFRVEVAAKAPANEKLNAYVHLVCGHLHGACRAPDRWVYYIRVRDEVTPVAFPTLRPCNFDFVSYDPNDFTFDADADRSAEKKFFVMRTIAATPDSGVHAIVFA